MITIDGKLHDTLYDKFFLELSNGHKIEVEEQTFLKYDIRDAYNGSGVIKGYVIMYKGRTLSDYVIGYNNYPIDLLMGYPPKIFKTRKQAKVILDLLNNRTKHDKYTIEQYRKEY